LELGTLIVCPLLCQLTRVEATAVQKGTVLEDQHLDAPQIVTAELDTEMVRAGVELAEHFTPRSARTASALLHATFVGPVGGMAVHSESPIRRQLYTSNAHGETNPIIAVPRAASSSVTERTRASAARLSSRAHTYAAGI